MERLAEFVHALPPPRTAVDIADVPGGIEAARWLEAHGRPARLVPAPSLPAETRLWEPSPGLRHFLLASEGKAGSALDLGCGAGRDAVFLALAGWRVTAVDRLPDALERAHTLAELHHIALDLRVLDLTREAPPEGPFDLVTAFRYLLPFEAMAASLAVGGALVIETFTDRERARTGKPRDPGLVLPVAGPPSLPEGLRLREYAVREIGGRELAFLWAERIY